MAENETRLRQLTSVLQLLEEEEDRREANRALAKLGLATREELEQLMAKTRVAIDKAKEAKYKEILRYVFSLRGGGFCFML